MTDRHAGAAAAQRAAGIAFIVGSLICFAALDTTTKLIGTVVPAAMALWFRFLVQTVLVGACLLYTSRCV